MKRNHFFLLLLCTLFFHPLFGQTNFPLENSAAMDAFYKKTTNRPRLTGKLTHYTPADKALVMTYSLSIPDSESQIGDTIQIADDGSFEIPAHQAFPNQEVFLIIGDYYTTVFLDQGLRMEIDLELLKKDATAYNNPAVKLSGPDAPVNVYMNKFYDYKDRHLDSTYNEDMMKQQELSLSFAERTTCLNKARATEINIEDSFIKENGDAYAWILRNDQLSRYYTYVIRTYNYTESKERFFPPDSILQQIFSHQPILTSGSCSEYYRTIAILFTNRHFRPFQELKASHLSPEKTELVLVHGNMGKLPDEKLKYEEDIIPYLQSYWAKDSQAKKLKELNSDNDQIDQKVKKAAIKKNTKRPYGTLVADFDFGAQLYTSNLTTIDSLIDHIRALNPGKAVILDIWTVWCSGCISDMKTSVDSKKQLKEGGVEVVYLCLENNSTPEKWQKIVAKNAVGGTYFYLNTDQTAQIIKKFGINSYPTFALFNKAGVVYPKFTQWISGLTLDMLKDKL